MSKAEDLSSQYRDFREQCGIKDPVMLNEIEEAYYEGYQQAEKDLELGLEDIKTIDKLLNQCVDYNNPYQEVLKRYKERKEK
jgi:hypothetical protein